MIDPETLAGVIQLLQKDPGGYKSFGMYWWPVKRWLKAATDRDTLPMVHGPADDPRARARLERMYPDERMLWLAALHHHQQKVLWGERYQPHSYWPDGSPYVLDDPDMGVAAAVGS